MWRIADRLLQLMQPGQIGLLSQRVVAARPQQNHIASEKAGFEAASLGDPAQQAVVQLGLNAVAVVVQVHQHPIDLIGHLQNARVVQQIQPLSLRQVWRKCLCGRHRTVAGQQRRRRRKGRWIDSSLQAVVLPIGWPGRGLPELVECQSKGGAGEQPEEKQNVEGGGWRVAGGEWRVEGREWRFGVVDTPLITHHSRHAITLHPPPSTLHPPLSTCHSRHSIRRRREHNRDKRHRIVEVDRRLVEVAGQPVDRQAGQGDQDGRAEQGEETRGQQGFHQHPQPAGLAKGVLDRQPWLAHRVRRTSAGLVPSQA